MKRDEKKGGRIRRAEAQSVLWFSLSLAASLHSFQHSLLHNLLLFITAAELLSNCNAFLFARIAWRRNLTFDPESMWGLNGERESETCLASHLASPLHLDLHVQYKSAACCWAVNVTEMLPRLSNWTRWARTRPKDVSTTSFLPSNSRHLFKTSATVRRTSCCCFFLRCLNFTSVAFVHFTRWVILLLYSTLCFDRLHVCMTKHCI